MADDDLLDPNEIESLLKDENENAGGEATPPSADAATEPSGAAAEEVAAPADAEAVADGEDPLDGFDEDDLGGGDESALLSSEQIEMLLQQSNMDVDSGDSSPAPAADDSAAAQVDQLLNQAEAGLAAAIANDSPKGERFDTRGALKFEFEQFGTPVADANNSSTLKVLQDVELDLRIELGRAELLIEDVVRLKEGSVVPLDKLAGDPVDILVNGRLIARGEVLVLNDNFCVRVAEILSPDI